MDYRFPFGQPVHPVVQQDRTFKRAFVLGVYASAVHAVWVSHRGRVLVRALAVASEPEIFWRGENAAEIVGGITVPHDAGYLLPANPSLNGPSGRTLDTQFLRPMGLSRSDAWLCDLLPASRVNHAQQRALKRHYRPLVERGLLPEATVPLVPSIFADDARRRDILAEVTTSRAELLVLFGDKPIREFLAPLTGLAPTLTELTASGAKYGKQLSVRLN